jgi:sulfoxide reductase heme-binding subunit YedZ
MTLSVASIGPSAYWYLTRGTGAVALLLLTASVVLGVLGSLRFSSARWPRFAVDTLHRDISLLVIVVLVVHIVTSVLDSFAPIAWTDAVIPFASSYRPLWLGFGALSFDLLLALVVTSLVRRRLGYQRWRAIHWLAYASWPVAVLHGLGTGSDTKLWWMLALTAVCVAAVVAAVAVRIARAAPPRGVRMPAAALSFAAPIALVVFTVAGPLQPGWARRAGTPAKLLGAKASAPAAAVTRRTVATPVAATGRPFSGTLAGRVSQTSQAGGAIVDLSLRLSGPRSGRLRVRLAGSPVPGGGLSMTGSQVDLIAAGLPSVMEGKIVSLRGEDFLARLQGAAGTALDARARLHIDTRTDDVSGELAVTWVGGR